VSEQISYLRRQFLGTAALSLAATRLVLDRAAPKFSGKYAHRTINGGVGHNLPQEAPVAFAQAVVDVSGHSA
jgi:hypothetical protein